MFRRRSTRHGGEELEHSVGESGLRALADQARQLANEIASISKYEPTRRVRRELGTAWGHLDLAIKYLNRATDAAHGITPGHHPELVEEG